ncbi:MAG: class I SAM-dependent methyltransferase [Planctomycetota bacterium]
MQASLSSIIAADPEFSGSIGTDKHTVHSYIAHFYELVLPFYRDRSISFLEIGINNGASLALWASYFSDSRIVGVDISDNVNPHWRGHQNIEYFFFDAYEVDKIKSQPDFDLIIDDGCHTLRGQMVAIQSYSQKLLPGGMLVIEDIQDPEMLTYLESAVPDGFSATRLDLRSIKRRYDDLLLIVRRDG